MRVLHIDSSSRYDGSITRQLSAYFINLIVKNEKENYEYLDLARDTPRAVSGLQGVAMYTPPENRTANMVASLRDSDVYVEQLLRSELVILAGVLGWPFHLDWMRCLFRPK